MATDRPSLPSELDPKVLRRRALQVIGLLVVLGLAAALTPGLGELRGYLRHAEWGWIGVAVVLEALSGFSYVLMFKPIFCRIMPWRGAMQLGWSELAMGSIVPASGIGGLALGAWALSRDGMDPDFIAERSVAFFLIKSMVNFVAVAVIGLIMFVGVGPHQPFWLTIVPALMSLTVISMVFLLPRIGEGEGAAEDAHRVRHWIARARATLIKGTGAAGLILSRNDPKVYLGTLGYWAFDNAVIWATFHAFGVSPPITVILMGYLIGQLGGLLPIPGGVGGIDGGLLGTLVVYGTQASATAAAVLAYRVILFWLPLLAGAAAFAALRRGLNDPDEHLVPET